MQQWDLFKKTYFDKTSVTILKYLIKTTITTYNLPFSITFYQSSFFLFTQSSHTHFIFLLLLLLLSISLSFLFLNASEQQGERNDICLISVHVILEIILKGIYQKAFVTHVFTNGSFRQLKIISNGE